MVIAIFNSYVQILFIRLVILILDLCFDLELLVCILAVRLYTTVNAFGCIWCLSLLNKLLLLSMWLILFGLNFIFIEKQGITTIKGISVWVRLGHFCCITIGRNHGAQRNSTCQVWWPKPSHMLMLGIEPRSHCWEC